MASQMMAAVLYGREEVRIEPVDVPEVGPGDVLVRVRAALTCGTDVKVFRRGYHARMIVPPALFGHELAGDIVEVGDEVIGFREGQRVVAANSAPCLRCFYCRKGNENLCEDLLFNNGAYAEFIRIPARIVERNLYQIPDHVSYQDAALVEPLACVLRGMSETPIAAGDFVAVIGLGPIGLMFVRMAALRGANVIAVGRRQAQLERAGHMGARYFVNTTEGDPVQAVHAITGGYGVDAAIECVGKPEMWQMAVAMLRKGGTVNLFGGCPSGTQVQLDTQTIHYSEITCKASFHHTPRHIREALHHVARGNITARDFVNEEQPLANLLRVLQQLSQQNGALKTAIIP